MIVLRKLNYTVYYLNQIKGTFYTIHIDEHQILMNKRGYLIVVLPLMIDFPRIKNPLNRSTIILPFKQVDTKH